MYFSCSPGHDLELHAYLYVCVSVSPNGTFVAQARGLCPFGKQLGKSVWSSGQRRVFLAGGCRGKDDGPWGEFVEREFVGPNPEKYGHLWDSGGREVINRDDEGVVRERPREVCNRGPRTKGFEKQEVVSGKATEKARRS